MRNPFFRAAVVAALLLAATVAPLQAQPQSAARVVFDDYWERTAQMYPEWATYRGDNRFGDKLNDGSPEARARGYAFEREMLARLQALPRQDMNAQDRMSVDILARQLDQSLAWEAHRVPAR
jgi:uncharacterized protein (DUF885 family)